VSSNPSISGTLSQPLVFPPPHDDTRRVQGYGPDEHPSVRREDGPKWTWEDEELVDRYDSSFDLYIVGGTRQRRADGSLTRATMFWSAVKKRAEELIPHRPVRPGLDYALTEVVRCKSRQERGVPAAVDTCSGRYLRETLECASARVLVVLGRWARIAMERQLNLRSASAVIGPIGIARRERLVVFLPHPTAFAARTFKAVCTPDELGRLRAEVAS
jgi:hypothetical protein